MAKVQTFTWQEIVNGLLEDDNPEAAKAVMARYGPPPPIYTETGLRLTKQYLEVEDCKPSNLLEPAVVRCLAEYVLSRPAVTRGLLAFCDEGIQGFAENGKLGVSIPTPTAPIKRTRGKITDPNILEQRNLALTKARAERARRLKEQREALALAAATPEPAREPVEVG